MTMLSWTGVAKAKDSSVGLNFELPPTRAVAVAPIAEVLPIEKATDAPAKEVPLVRPQETLPPLNAPINAPNQEESVATAANSIDIGVQFGDDLLERYNERYSTDLEQDEEISVSTTELGSLDNREYGDGDLDSLGFDDWIFEGGARSLVARTVGSAEGTRRWDGNKTQAYYGHKDPGNGAWNLGTFSYQHEADTPEEADAKQIKRLKFQGSQLENQAAQRGMTLSLVEKLNGIDLANQAPLAALGKGGYIERLAQAHQSQMRGEEAIAWARTRAYIDPSTKAWDAPGLGNNVYSITKDQERRMFAIDKALRAYDSETDDDSLALAEPQIENQAAE